MEKTYVEHTNERKHHRAPLTVDEQQYEMISNGLVTWQY